MANSTTNIDQLTESMEDKEEAVNEFFDPASPALNFGRRASTTAGLTWGYYGGTIDISGTPTQIANGTVALSDNATNYVKRTAAGVVSKVTSAPSGWPAVLAGVVALYTVVTSGGVITSYTDHRLSTGTIGPAGAANEGWTTLTDGATVTPDTLSGTVHNFYWVIGGNRTLAAPTGIVDGQTINILVKQDGTGTRVWTPNSVYKFAQSVNVLSTPANTVDLYSGIYHSSLGIIAGVLAKAIA